MGKKEQEQRADETTVWPGDVFKCEKCGCEVRVLKKGYGDLHCCGQKMTKQAELNPALSW